ncbi:hypothetical protein CSA57_04695 [candidate division KSB3 bacterium]|nr:MAG: hypothetical protein CSA57_04695 [candidate division KSB3 bacterium]
MLLLFYYFASSFQQRAQREKAIICYEKLLKHHPNFLDANFLVAECYFIRHDIEKSQYYFERQLSSDTMHWKTYARLVEIEHGRQNKPAAFQYLQEIYKIDAMKQINPDELLRLKRMVEMEL